MSTAAPETPVMPTDARDAQEQGWQAAMARLRARRPAEDWVRFDDPEAEAALADARKALRQVRQEVTERFVQAIDPDDSEATKPEEVPALVAASEEVKAAEAVIAMAEQTLDDLAVVFHFRALPPDVYEALQLAHPATDEEAATGKGWHMETYMPALISACSVNPLSPEEVRGLVEAQVVDGETLPAPLNQADYGVLFATCRSVNETTRVSLGKGSRPTRP